VVTPRRDLISANFQKTAASSSGAQGILQPHSEGLTDIAVHQQENGQKNLGQERSAGLPALVLRLYACLTSLQRIAMKLTRIHAT
jgi:hypothetical protein